ncbi:NAD(P)H-hydrate dehydratase [Aureivirga sp. CE67]|uniref:NAD(P)H-hydrate dehydratase n=1 Tax=Aureivirga sp. CE67 TaxID=1788983 RepID=UPI0018C9437C|nr:NAD(P)H-hydrate dehydratase [Aureivirga sp. CE67]
MKIPMISQIYEADRETVKRESIVSIDLMERAAKACVKYITNKKDWKKKRFYIFCGTGNNGGDGLAIARMLAKKKYTVEVYIVPANSNRSEDFATNFNALLKSGVTIYQLEKKEDFPHITSNSVIIDAIFGIGLNRSVLGLPADVIEEINKVSDSKIISIDVPSGFFAEKSLNSTDVCVHSDVILTFQFPKLAFMLPENEKFIHKWQVLDIGLNMQFIDELKVTVQYVDLPKIKSIYRKRTKFSHKGAFGHVLMMGGSYGKIGAAVLATKAAIRTGAGLTTAYIPSCGYQVMQATVPEAMVEVDSDDTLEYFDYSVHPTVIGVGVGMGTASETIQGFEMFLHGNKIPLVVDADGINILAKNKLLIKHLPKDSVLTPHPKELERLIGEWENDFDKLDKLREFTVNHEVIIVLKGANTMIVKEGMIYINSTGNPGLATGGSGDVLTGIIAGLIAQKYTPIEAAILGVYLHGLTADIALKQHTHESFIASDILKFLPKAFKAIQK